jgi:hypothetical protein
MKGIITRGPDRGKKGMVVGRYMDGRADIRINRKVKEYGKNQWCWE